MEETPTQEGREQAASSDPKNQTRTPEQWAEEVGRLRDRLEQLTDAHGALATTNKDLKAAIAERLQVEEGLRQREEAFRALVENSPDEISRFDREFRYLYINRRAERFLGKRLDQSGLPDQLVSLWKIQFQNVFDTGRPDLMEYEATVENGSRRFFQSRLVPEFTPEGEVDSVLIVSRDITLRKRAEEKAEKAKTDAEQENRAKDECILKLRQEIVGLEQAILDFAQIVKSENSQPGQRENLEQIVKDNRHLELIDKILGKSLAEVVQQ